MLSKFMAMNKDGAIIIIEDDEDDQFVLEEVFKDLGYPNERHYFSNGMSALEFLSATEIRPFIILSDINLPKLNGLELRRKLHNDAELSLRCIPYIYLTTALNQQTVIDAYSTSAQGFFVKPATFEHVREMIDTIIGYWKKCAAPNHF